MSGPFFSGYDSWKTREPDWDYEVCDHCGHAMVREGRGWFCERCDMSGPDEPDYDAWAKEQP